MVRGQQAISVFFPIYLLHSTKFYYIKLNVFTLKSYVKIVFRLRQCKILTVLNSGLMCSSALLTSFSTLFLSVSVLCAERVGQMTKTYNDIDAVTRLLEEVKV